MTHPGTLPDGGNSTASIVPPSPVTPGQEDVRGLRVAAALIDLALLAGLFLIIASAAGLVTAGWQQHSGAARTPVGGTRKLWSNAAATSGTASSG
jgi:hypothetical protein